MFVNCNKLRLRQIDRTVIWVKRGAEIDETLLLEEVLARLTRTNQLVATVEEIGTPIDYSKAKPKTVKKATKKVTKKVTKKAVKKTVKREV